MRTSKNTIKPKNLCTDPKKLLNHFGSFSAARGRDPLAIQNSSVFIYTKMVGGITNGTNEDIKTYCMVAFSKKFKH